MTAGKKATKKKTAKPTGRAVKKAVVKKPTKRATKKTVTKKSKRTAKKSSRTTAKTKVKPTAKKASKTVKLPTKASDSMKDKVSVAHQVIDRLNTPMRHISYVGAICFILVGLLTISSEYSPAVANQVGQVCDSIGCGDDLPPDDPDGNGTSSDDPPPDAPPPEGGTEDSPQEPVIELFGDLPNVLVGTLQVGFQVFYSSTVYAEIINQRTGQLDEMPVQQLSDENYRLTLHEEELEPGSYDVVIIAESNNGQMMVEQWLGSFAVEEPPEEEELPPEEDPPVEDEPLPEDEASNTEETDSTGTENQEDTEAGDETNTTDSADQNYSEDESDEEVYEEDAPPEDDNQEPDVTWEIPLDLVISGNVWERREIIEAVTGRGFREVELFVRPEMALQANFLGKMRRQEVTDEAVFWIYDFDSRNLPNGTYEVIAIASSDARPDASVSQNVEVFNYDRTESEPYKDSLVDEAPDYNDELDYPPPEGETLVVDLPIREFYRINDESESEEDEFSDYNSKSLPDAGELVDEVVENSQDDLNELLERYSTAVQGDNPIVREAVEREIAKKREEFMTRLIEDGESERMNSINREMIERFDQYKERVDTFESIRQSRLGDGERKDSDGDGISDFDEVNVYDTDPDNPDSDNDGFIDGAEVARGFDPTSGEPEVVLDYELPTEVVGLKRADALEVIDVRPVVSTDTSDETFVEAEIRGVGLPNSFVTLYIFSSPVIVTVKTEDDGSFVYRFDKELEDGEHEVFVAFTDNTGDILAHSEPFQFVKRAQAFTPIDEAAAAEVATEAPTVVEASTTNAVKVVLGMSVLVLGFILIMFGVYLRQNEPVVENIIVEDDKQTA